MSLSLEEVQNRVDRGADWLDAVEPMWWKSISKDKLNMADARMCIMGQTFAKYLPDSQYHVNGFDYGTGQVLPEDIEAYEYGFDTSMALSDVEDIDGAEPVNLPAIIHGSILDIETEARQFSVLDVLWLTKIQERIDAYQEQVSK